MNYNPPVPKRSRGRAIVRPPGSYYPGGPGYWRDEASGALAPAVRRYLLKPHTMTGSDIALMREYLREWISSPAWNIAGRANLPELRRAAREIATVDDIRIWLGRATEADVDPL